MTMLQVGIVAPSVAADPLLPATHEQVVVPPAQIQVVRVLTSFTAPLAAYEAVRENLAKQWPSMQVTYGPDLFLFTDGQAGLLAEFKISTADPITLCHMFAFRIDGGMLTQLEAVFDVAATQEFRDDFRGILQAFRPRRLD